MFWWRLGAGVVCTKHFWGKKLEMWSLERGSGNKWGDFSFLRIFCVPIFLKEEKRETPVSSRSVFTFFAHRLAELRCCVCPSSHTIRRCSALRWIYLPLQRRQSDPSVTESLKGKVAAAWPSYSECLTGKDENESGTGTACALSEKKVTGKSKKERIKLKCQYAFSLSR